MKRTKFPSIAGLVAGFVAVIWAIVMFSSGADDSKTNISSMDTGTRTSYSYYGGDAYTGIQQAAADTARNVKAQSDIIIAGFNSIKTANNAPAFAAILLFVGLGMICHFAHKLSEIDAKTIFEYQVLTALQNVSGLPHPAGQPAVPASAPVPAPAPEPEPDPVPVSESIPQDPVWPQHADDSDEGPEEK